MADPDASDLASELRRLRAELRRTHEEGLRVNLETLRAARQSGQVDVRLSLPDLEDFLGVWGHDRATAIKRLRIARDLAGFDGLLKQPSDILEEAIAAYAAGDGPPSPLIPLDRRRYIAAMLERIAEGSTDYDQTMPQVLAEVRGNKESFKAGMARARDNSLDELATRFTPRLLIARYCATRWRGGQTPLPSQVAGSVTAVQ